MPARKIYYLGVEYKYVGRDGDGNLIYEGPSGAQITRRESDDDGEEPSTGKSTVTNNLWQNYAFGGANPVTDTNPVIVPNYDTDIPMTSGPGKFSKQGIKNEAKNNHRVIDAIMHDLRVLLKRTNNVNGRPVEETIVLNGGKPGAGTYTVTFAGDLNSNGTMVPDHEVTYTYPPLPGYDPAGSTPNTETATPPGSSASGPLGTGSPSGDDGGGSTSGSSNSNSDNDVTNSSDATSSADEVTKKTTDEERSDKGKKEEKKDEEEKNEENECYPAHVFTVDTAPPELHEYLARLQVSEEYTRRFNGTIGRNDTVYLKVTYTTEDGRKKISTVRMQQGLSGGHVHQFKSTIEFIKGHPRRVFALEYVRLNCKERISSISSSGPKPLRGEPKQLVLRERDIPPMPIIPLPETVHPPDPFPNVITLPISFFRLTAVIPVNAAGAPNLSPIEMSMLRRIARRINGDPNGTIGFYVFGNSDNPSSRNTITYIDENGNTVRGTVAGLMLARARAIINLLVRLFRVNRNRLIEQVGRDNDTKSIDFREFDTLTALPTIQ